MKETTVEVDGATLFYHCDKVAENAPWVIFSNSLLTDLSIWDAQVAALRSRFNILRYDQRGHGRSTSSQAQLDFDLLGRDLLAVMDAAGVETCSAIGLSMGVPTVLAAYRDAPQRFTKLVFVDGMARTAPTGAAAWQERIELARSDGMPHFTQLTASRWLQPATFSGLEGSRLMAIMAATPLDGFVQCARALQSYDYRDTLAEISVPLLAIAGEQDGAIPATMQKVFSPLPGAKIRVIPNAGHVPNFEQPDAFNTALSAFLDSA